MITLLIEITVQKRRKNAVLWKKSTVDSNFNIHFSKKNGEMKKKILTLKHYQTDR
jgi:hypothetical protein